MRASGLLLDVMHSSDTVSLTRASLGPVTVTVFGPTEVYINASKFLHKNQSLQAVRAFLSIFIEESNCFAPPLSGFRIAQHKHKAEYENVQVVV